MKLKKLAKIALGLAAARAAAKGGRAYGGSYRRRKPSMKARIFEALLSRLVRR